MSPLRRVHTWIEDAPSIHEGGDPISNAFFRLNKALLVYVMLPLLVIMGIIAVTH